MLRKKTRPLNRDESEVFMKLCLAMPEKVKIEDADAPPAYKILKGRLEWAGFDQCMTTDLLLWCCFLCNSPGKVVMWAWQLAYLSKNVYNGPISMTQWTDEFPMGVPTDEVYRDTWELQKDGGANLLDRLKYWPGQEKGDYLMKKWGMSPKED
jgi:hypothetical protein